MSGVRIQFTGTARLDDIREIVRDESGHYRLNNTQNRETFFLGDAADVRRLLKGALFAARTIELKGRVK